MKILAIMGSPRGKGSGYKIVKMIENRMIAKGDVDFKYLFLKDANLKPCIGCYICMAKGEDKCPLKDDRALIEQELLAADGVILSSPVYVDNVSWLMKTFIDRFAYTNHRPCFHRQKVLTVANTGVGGQKETLSALKKALGGQRISGIVHELAITTPPWPQTERAVAKKERAMDAAADKFYKACLDTAPPKPTFSNYLNFLIMQKFSLVCRQYLPADYAFYQGKTYYFDARINPIKAAAAKAIVRIMIPFIKGMGPGNIPWPVSKKEE